MGIAPYYDEGGITIYHGDCRSILPSLATASVDLMLTDPPYNVSETNADIQYTGGGIAKLRDFGAWDRSEWTPDHLLAESVRLLRKGGSLLSFCSDRLLSAYRTATDLAPRGTLVWYKTNPPPQPRPGYVQATEWCVWLAKPGKAVTWNSGGYTLNVLSYPICGGSERTAHPTQKPIAMIEALILRHTNPGDLIVDPYAGSGTTAEAAKKLGRRCIAIEQSLDYVELAVSRLQQEVLQLW